MNGLNNGNGWMVKVLSSGKMVLTSLDGYVGKAKWEESSLVKGRASVDGLAIGCDDVVDTLNGLANDGFNCFLIQRDIALSFSLGLILG